MKSPAPSDPLDSSDPSAPHSCCHRAAKTTAAFPNAQKTLAAVLVIAVILTAARFWEPMEKMGRILGEYLSMIAWAVGLGLLIGGLLERFVPHWYVERLMSGSQKRSIARSVMIGFFMSACCHGILAVAVELYRKGASTASVVAFLLASPWANLPLTILLAGFFGWKSVYFIFGAIGIAYVTGRLFQLFETRGWVERNPHTSGSVHTGPIWQDVTRRWKGYSWSLGQLAGDARSVLSGSARLGDMVLWWILIGGLAASVIGAYVPSHWMHRYLGPGIGGLSLTLLGAALLEVCSEGTAPLAFEIYRQTGAFGNAFVFLMAGVATDYTEIGILWQAIGRRAAILMPLVAVPQILLLGILANYLF